MFRPTRVIAILNRRRFPPWVHGVRPLPSPLVSRAAKPHTTIPTVHSTARYIGTQVEPTPLTQPTIFALASAPGKAGVAVVRISGPRATQALLRMTRSLQSSDSDTGIIPKPRRVTGRRIISPTTGIVLDRGLAVFFPGPHSYTGEDVVEFHAHGGAAVIRAILENLALISGFRMAEAGEFSRRAFDNDKLDLTSLEGLVDLLNAETEAQRKQALRQAEGGLYTIYEQWRSLLVSSLANLEAVIDFGEDENIEEGVYANVRSTIEKLANDIQSYVSDERRGEIIRSGIHVAIIGPPNVGKSSFLNLLAQRQVAIVSPVAGTTRDVLESTIDIGGYPVVISDTAGLHESTDVIEMEGMRRARERVFLIDAAALLPDRANILPNLTSIVDQLAPHPDLGGLPQDEGVPTNLWVFNKCDLVPPPLLAEWIQHLQQLRPGSPVASLSCHTQAGFDDLLHSLAAHIQSQFDTSSAPQPLITQVRHRQQLRDCLECLETFLDMEEGDVVLAAEELRYGAQAIGKITGRVGVEDILDVLFSQFCIGK
ncbi:tRNA modification GTPase GTPBP3, mitochondrial [Dimargaris cristalligena]|uniref:tRNA modification GTPase GTPBP3, mitochondrial n=1 Tax=Dimargaris cristalligena TaxID=215637 RepID=A0A4V1J4J3_9FUNG|nr:tRNA modification GTPase GTPBP3, mitochondrial [Dimargaris cristalligena]|eukprot:RKP35759.1 tRNA modification GTPase GTPBP3, mitochondrial [Dimargaris cristalligena]